MCVVENAHVTCVQQRAELSQPFPIFLTSGFCWGSERGLISCALHPLLKKRLGGGIGVQRLHR